MGSTENLISMIQLYPILYDRRCSDYKNMYKRDMAWQQIASDLNEDPEAIKNRWKNLKDGYTKYRKSLVKKTVKKGRVAYENWVWGPYMSFIDETLVPHDETNEQLVMDVKKELVDVKKEKKSPESRSSRCSSPEASGTQSPDPFDMIEVSMDPMAKRRKKDQEVNNCVEKLLTHLVHVQKKDSIDLLFASYAKELKKMRPNVQTTIKLKMAQMFAEAEMEELKNSTTSGT